MSSGTDEHLYVVTYDIADDKRWRVVSRLMHGFGEWLQLSVFQCRLTRMRHVELTQKLTAAINLSADHVLIVDLGPAEKVEPRVQSIGKRGFDPIERTVVIV